ncbi:phage major capsid protein [Angustibacter luteus]|uniref:Phage major capsid protein n=1 Tax=Angustibacter luteus TaxID=658456 RepID=A0ABW1JJJ4_9ACTN
MTIEQLIAQIRAAMKAKLDQRAEHQKAVQAVREACSKEDNRDPSDDEATKIRSAQDEIRKIDEDIAASQTRITELEAEKRSDEAAQRLAGDLARANGNTGDRAPVTTSEERTYSQRKSARGETSFFVDSYRAMNLQDMAAQQRLQRHMVEVEREGEVSERAVATSGLAGLVVPQYLIDQAALVIRAGRPVANAVQHLDLPEQGMSILVPRGTTGAAAASQATENSALQNTDEVWANLTVPVVTIGGQQDVSRQALERGAPGIDEIVYLDLAGAYQAELDRQVINGSGASNQMLGILQTAGINAATAYGAAITPVSFNTKINGQITAVASVGVGISPKLQIMHPRRWGWLSAQVDGQNRPLVPVTAPFNAMGVNAQPGTYGGDGQNLTARDGYQVVGSFAGLPVVTDANVPTNLGTLNEDAVIVADTAQALLWEDGDGMPRQLRFEQTLGNQLTVKLVVYGYAAFTAGRYPTAFGKTGGLDGTAGWGQIAPTF